MQTIFADITISMSEFKKNPASVLRQAGSRPVAVLNHNKAAFYMVEPRLFEALLDELVGQEAGRTVIASAMQAPQDRSPGWRAVMARMNKMATGMTLAAPSPPEN